MMRGFISRSRLDTVAMWAALGWLAVYALVVISGQRFSTAYLNFGWQLIPWDVLTENPWSSVWYLHIQPPLWNLLLGVAAWASPLSDAVTLQVVMACFGVLAAASAALLGRRIGLGHRTSIIVAIAVTVHPEVLKGAFEPTYELAVAALLLTALALVAGLKSPDSLHVDSSHVDSAASTRLSVIERRVVMLAVVVTAVSMTRSLYHPIWALIVIAIALWFVRRQISRRAVVAAIAIPVIVMGGWMVKNLVLFDQANLSSWFGMNLQRAVIPVLDLEDLEAMRERGDVSEIAMIGPFGKYELYEDAVEPCEPTRSHRALSEPMRTTDQWSPNFNYECYLPIFDRAGQDAWAVIRAHPEVWLEGRLWSLRSTASVAITPAESSSVVMRGLDQIYSWMRLDYAGVLSTRGWGTPIYGQLTAPVDFGLMLVPLYGAVALVGLVPLVRGVRRQRQPEAGPVLILSSLTIVFTVLVGAVAELGEQARFRTMTDPLAMVIAAGMCAVISRRLKTKVRTRLH
jgi:hypothetical protein